MSDEQSHVRGTRHLRVVLDYGVDAAAVSSMWVVDQSVVQHASLHRPVVAVVELGGESVLVQSFDDPTVLRGSYRKSEGHSFGHQPSGQMDVCVPFVSALELKGVRISIADTSQFALADRTAERLTELIAVSPPKGVDVLRVGYTDLECHAAWDGVLEHLGAKPEPGRFEIYCDDGLFYWRVSQRDGTIVARSDCGVARRGDVEAEIQWLKARVRQLPVRSLDQNVKRAKPDAKG